MANRLNVANIGYNDATDALTIDSSGNVTASGTLSAGTISEAVADAGVSIDGVVAKDSKVFAPSGIVFASAEITGDVAGTTNRVESSNLLDDYEEGTWTPTLNTGTPDAQRGIYIKIGNFVWLTGRVQYTITDTSTDYLRLSGLPFTIPSDTNNGGYQVMFVGVSGTHGWETYDGNGNLALGKDGSAFLGDRTVYSGKSFDFKFFYPASVI